MALSATFNFSIDVAETLASGVDGASNPIINHNGYNVTGRYTDASTPDVEYCVVKSVALSAGAYTLDLTNMTGTNGAAVNGNAKKIRLLRITVPGTNAITVAKGASNGHTGLGSSFSLVIPAGGTVALDLSSNGVAISGTDKTLDFSGTGTDTFKLTLVLG